MCVCVFPSTSVIRYREREGRERKSLSVTVHICLTVNYYTGRIQVIPLQYQYSTCKTATSHRPVISLLYMYIMFYFQFIFSLFHDIFFIFLIFAFHFIWYCCGFDMWLNKCLLVCRIVLPTFRNCLNLYFKISKQTFAFKESVPSSCHVTHIVTLIWKALNNILSN